MRATSLIAALVYLSVQVTLGFLYGPESVYRLDRGSYYEIMTQCEQEGGECVDIDLGEQSVPDPPATPAPTEAPDSTDPPYPAPLLPNQPIYRVLPVVDPYVPFVPQTLPPLPPKTTTTTYPPPPYYARVPQKTAQFVPRYVPNPALPMKPNPFRSMFPSNYPPAKLMLPKPSPRMLSNPAPPKPPNTVSNPALPMSHNPVPRTFPNQASPMSLNYLPIPAPPMFPRPSPKFVPKPAPLSNTPAPSPIKIIPNSVLYGGSPKKQQSYLPAEQAMFDGLVPPMDRAAVVPNQLYFPKPPAMSPAHKPATLPPTTTMTHSIRFMYVERELHESRQRRAVPRLDNLYGECAGGWEFDLGCSNKGKNVCCFPASARRRRK